MPGGGGLCSFFSLSKLFSFMSKTKPEICSPCRPIFFTVCGENYLFVSSAQQTLRKKEKERKKPMPPPLYPMSWRSVCTCLHERLGFPITSRQVPTDPGWSGALSWFNQIPECEWWATVAILMSSLDEICQTIKESMWPVRVISSSSNHGSQCVWYLICGHRCCEQWPVERVQGPHAHFPMRLSRLQGTWHPNMTPLGIENPKSKPKRKPKSNQSNMLKKSIQKE